jgi:hypothetical protein
MIPQDTVSDVRRSNCFRRKYREPDVLAGHIVSDASNAKAGRVVINAPEQFKKADVSASNMKYICRRRRAGLLMTALTGA